MKVIIVNPNAKRVRRRGVVQRIQNLAGSEVAVLVTQSVEEMRRRLSGLAAGIVITRLYVVGGDGTFHQVLNWVLAQPPERRPALMSVGGGEICYLTLRCGFRSLNLEKNLRRGLGGPTRIEAWRPLAITDSERPDETRYAAIFANGLVYDFIAWYEEVGKGSMWKVACMIVEAASMTLVSDRLRQWHGRLLRARGIVEVNRNEVIAGWYSAVLLGTVDRILPLCEPFVRTGWTGEFGALMHWGTFRTLALGLPFLFRGRVPSWMERTTLNTSAKIVKIVTESPNVILDGDAVTLPSPPGRLTKRTLTITTGPSVDLLVVA